MREWWALYIAWPLLTARACVRGWFCRWLGHLPTTIWSLTEITVLGERRPYYTWSRTIKRCRWCNVKLSEVDGII